MDYRLLEKLKEQEIDIDDILRKTNEEVSKGNEILIKCIKLYSSVLEGLGSKNSDLDVYVIVDDKNIDQIDKRVIRFELEKVVMDVELYGNDEFQEFIKKSMENSEENILGLKTITKFFKAECIYGECESEKLDASIPMNQIKARAQRFFMNNTCNLRDDSQYMSEMGDFESALFLARDAVLQSMAYINVSSGNINFKRKWISRIFSNNEGYQGDLLERYKKLCVYSQIDSHNIESIITDAQSLSRDIVSAAAFV